MCGIVGYVDLNNAGRVEEHILQRMADALIHRGPDSRGYFLDPNAGIGTRRLRIIDLETGDQPLFNEDRSLAPQEAEHIKEGQAHGRRPAARVSGKPRRPGRR